jgi:hypothetical protein
LKEGVKVLVPHLSHLSHRNSTYGNLRLVHWVTDSGDRSSANTVLAVTSRSQPAPEFYHQLACFREVSGDTPNLPSCWPLVKMARATPEMVAEHAFVPEIWSQVMTKGAVAVRGISAEP